jgi:hypothetical protein
MKRPTTNPTNTVHFACFGCRKAFNQPESSNWDAQVPRRPFDCPNCKLPMTRMGRYFKAPPCRAVRQWAKVELLYAFGERFVAGNSGFDKRCHSLPDAVRYLIESGHAESDVRARLKHIQERHA